MNTPTTAKRARIWILVLLCLVAGILWAANWFLLTKYVPDTAKQGQFGDMFGAVNALFTALAFAGLTYTVFLQRDQLALQQREIVESGETQRQLVEDQIRAQKQLFEEQKAHGIRLEQLRQEFDEIVEKRRRDRQTEDDDRFRNNVLRAIRYELEALHELYANGIGRDLANTPDGKCLRTKFAFTQDFFTVFEANAAHLGRISANTSKRIVKVYALLKAMVENLRINNLYIEELAKLEPRLSYDSTTPRKLVQTEHFDLQQAMRRHATLLKDHEKELEVEFKGLCANLDELSIT